MPNPWENYPQRLDKQKELAKELRKKKEPKDPNNPKEKDKDAKVQ